MSNTCEDTLPPHNSEINCAALESAFIVRLGSDPFSNRLAASVRRLCLILVRRTQPALKCADSRKILFVVADTPEFNPPYTPPIHIGFPAPSHIIKSS